jgi:L-asparaginase
MTTTQNSPVLPPAIALLSTGGTFEKIYDPLTGGLVFTESGIVIWKNQCRLPENTRLVVPFLVDSLDMTDAQRSALCDQIRDCPETLVVVIHGTDTLVASAQEARKTKRPEQVVLFTGAMVPASCAGSDALFNLGMAMAAVQCQPPGVWVACSGRIFSADAVEKDRVLGRFVARDPRAEGKTRSSTS